jgi:hypothetical protein
MGPEFTALVDIEKHIDLDSPDGQEIASIAASLGESCGQERGAHALERASPTKCGKKIVVACWASDVNACWKAKGHSVLL